VVHIVLRDSLLGGQEKKMSIVWIVIAVVVALGLLLFAVMDRAKHEDRSSRQIQRTISPFDEITITKPGD
jgi:hypothetical protein